MLLTQPLAELTEHEPKDLLTERELFMSMLVADGLKNREIATLTRKSEAVVKNYLRRIYDKLGLWNRTELALWYVRNVEHRQKQKEKAYAANSTT